LDPLTLRTKTNIRGPAPLDLLFHSHRPHERGDFIWRLSDALLTKALELNPPRYPTVESLLSCIGTPRTWWLRLLTSQPHRADGALASAAGPRPDPVFLPMRRVRLVLELLDSHGVHRCPATDEDFYAALLQFTQFTRLREWIEENRSTDGLWPIRHAEYRHAVSLLETAIQIEASAPPNQKSNATEIVRYLQTEYDMWSTVHWPMIRSQLSSHVIPDLTAIIVSYLLPSCGSAVVSSSDSTPSGSFQ
jgi:hypothetical protein